MRKIIAGLVMMVGLPVLAAGEKAKPPAAPPESKKTVETFVGRWAVEGTVSGLPGAKEPLKVKETITCKKAAGGLVASCAGKGSSAMGPYEDVSLVTWDAQGKHVRFIGMDSMGVVHDHACDWKDDKNLACAPLEVTEDGKPASVVFTLSWTDAKTFTATETTTFKDGSKITFEGKGKKK